MFPLSFRAVEELMLVRGVIVTYETIRQWCAKFGPVYAAGLRRRQPRPGDTWHLDEVFLTVNGRRHYLWRHETIPHPRLSPTVPGGVQRDLPCHLSPGRGSRRRRPAA